MRTVPYSPGNQKTIKMIRLEKFDQSDYSTLISWIETEEMLMQFGGPGFQFPLTYEQLDESALDPNRFSFKVMVNNTNECIGHCEVLVTDLTAKIGRVIIGNKNARGKGYGEQVMRELVKFALAHINRSIIELNVFDFNLSAIRCYEKVGFRINPDQKLERKVKGETWTALNMILDTALWNKEGKA
jgi:RimJ/RimL family protein N-acetyltransferase